MPGHCMWTMARPETTATMLLLNMTDCLQNWNVHCHLRACEDTPGLWLTAVLKLQDADSICKSLDVQHRHAGLTLLGPMLLSRFSASSASSQLLSSGSKTWCKAGDNVLPCGCFLLTSYLEQERKAIKISKRLVDLACTTQAVD